MAKSVTKEDVLKLIASLFAGVLLWIFGTIIYPAVDKVTDIEKVIAIHEERINRNTGDLANVESFSAQNRAEISRLQVNMSRFHQVAESDNRDSDIWYTGIPAGNSSIQRIDSSRGSFYRLGNSGYILHILSSTQESANISADWGSSDAGINEQLPVILYFRGTTYKRVGNFTNDRHSDHLFSDRWSCM